MKLKYENLHGNYVDDLFSDHGNGLIFVNKNNHHDVMNFNADGCTVNETLKKVTV